MNIATQDYVDSLENRIASLENMLGGMGYSMQKVARQEMTINSSIVEVAQTSFGLYTGLVVGTSDPWKGNKIKFFCPLFHNPESTADSLPWAYPVANFGGFDDSGSTWVPPAGSTVCILFENGNRSAPYYIGTTWHRNRGPDYQNTFGFNIDEYDQIYAGRRNGYLVGPDDGSQVFPPWNTENYNGYDITSIQDYDSNTDSQKLLTYPNIYGFKTPEKHAIKMVDGDPKCNRKWKRFEIMSSCGNWIMLKDDHLHYAGQWANPNCGGSLIADGDTSCIQGVSNSSQVDQLRGGFALAGLNAQQTSTENDNEDTFGEKSEEADCNGKVSNSKILGGHPSTGSPDTKYYFSQVGANPFFKHKQECRPYKGSNTPQNNICDLPQSGIQFMSISGHTFVMDDSVEEPSGVPTWDREFDFGCNDKYVGRTYWKSATGHLIEMSDVEGPQGDSGSSLRGKENYIKILTANGNKIELNDHTEAQKGCVSCPPNIGGSERGIHFQSTSNHTFDMVDEGNEQCAECRKDGGEPKAKAKKAYVKIRTGYGLYISLNDDNSQENTETQNIQIFCPQKDNVERGPHLITLQESATGPGLMYTQVGGNYVLNTHDSCWKIVGNPDTNPADNIETISGNNVIYTLGTNIQRCEKDFQVIAKNQIYLLAGEDNNSDEGYDGIQGCGGGNSPNVAAVLVYDYLTGSVKISDRVFASTSKNAQALNMFNLAPFVKPEGC